MALRGRIGAYRTAALHDSRALTVAARAARWAQFEAAVDPESVLPPEERLARISRLGVLARRGKTQARRDGDLVRLDLTPEQVALLAAAGEVG